MHIVSSGQTPLETSLAPSQRSSAIGRLPRATQAGPAFPRRSWPPTRIKNMECPRCSAEVEVEAPFCPSCGRSYPGRSADGIPRLELDLPTFPKALLPGKPPEPKPREVPSTTPTQSVARNVPWAIWVIIGTVVVGFALAVIAEQMLSWNPLLLVSPAPKVSSSGSPTATPKASASRSADKPSDQVSVQNYPTVMPKGVRKCGSNVGAVREISCDFAKVIAKTVPNTLPGIKTFDIKTPKSKKVYRFTCRPDKYVVCTLKTGEAVYIVRK